jgi:amino acid transporter
VTDSGAGQELHQRQSSGLVRQGKPFDAFAFNLFGLTIGVVAGWILLYGIPFYPGSNVLLTIVICFVCSAGFVLVYALFTAIMPRSGGDYVFIGRSLHPSIGFAANASFMFWVVMFIAISGILIAQIGLSTIFRQLGAATDNTDWATWGDWFYTDWGQFWSGLAAIAILGPLVVVSRRGLKNYFTFQKYLIIFALGTLLITIIVMLVMPGDSFVSSFDNYVQKFSGKSGAHAAMLEAGGSHGAFSFKQSAQAIVWPFYGVCFLVISCYWAGESRPGLRAQLTGMGSSFITGFVLLMITVGVALMAFGTDFLNALGLADPTKFGLAFTPFYTELAGTWTGSVIGIVMTLGMTAWLVSYVPFLSIMAIRSVLAWSFDGVAPQWFGRVDRRGNPVNATIFCYALALVLLVIYSFTDWLTVTTPLLSFAFTLWLTCLAAIVFPYRRRSLFEGSQGAIKVGGVPLLSIAGVAGLAGLTVIIVLLVTDVNSGTNWPADKGQIYAIIGAFLGAGALWGLSAAVQRARGIDVGDASRTLPVE